MEAYLIGAVIVTMLLHRSPRSDGVVGGGLALMWLWTGVAYHGLFLSSLNRAALLFGALFTLQGALFFHAGVIRRRLKFGCATGPAAWLGWALVLYAAALYPLLGTWAGQRYPEMPLFGITPSPVTIFTFGLLLLTTAPVSRSILIIPFVWSLIGGSAAFALSVPQDWLLLVSGVVAIRMLVLRDRGRAGGVAAA